MGSYGTPTKVPAVRKVAIPAGGSTVDWDGSGKKTGTVSVNLNALSPTVAGCGPSLTLRLFLTPPICLKPSRVIATGIRLVWYLYQMGTLRMV